MSELVVDVSSPGTTRWLAVAPRGFVAGRAGLWSLPPPAPPGAARLSLSVEPRWRRRGIGSRLLAAVRADARGRLLRADVGAGSPGEAFCRRHGFRRTGSRRHDLLTYCDVHQAWLAELVDADHPGYRLATWTGDLPDHPGHRLASWTGDLSDRPGHRLASWTGDLSDRPRDAVLTAAETGGALAAYAVAITGPGERPRARQYGPAVLPGHSERRIGLWVNAALIQRVRESHPHVTEIEAATSGDDAGLLAVRRQLGFRPVRRTRLYELETSP
ncbi:GNAT family N-acetyltransferase [Actinoplanes sp. CA-054009]